MTKLNGKVAVVTGGNSGIGYASAKDLIDNGAQVVITGRNPEAVNRAARELGAEGIVADQSSLSDTDHLVEQVKAKSKHPGGPRLIMGFYTISTGKCRIE